MKKLITPIKILTFCVMAIVAFWGQDAMAAARFWVGGTGNWDASDTTHWAATSGGAGGQSVPVPGDTVTLDASSGGGTVTVTAAVSVTSITAGAFTGTLDTNGQSITTSGTFSITGSGTRTITLGASVMSVNAWNAATVTNLTFNANTSSITMIGAGQTFSGGGLTYNDVSLTGSGPTISGTNTFANLTRTGTATKTNTWTLSNNQVITGTLAINGNSSVNRILVQSSSTGTTRTLTAATVSVSNVDFQDITGAGAGSWNLSAITGLSGDAGGNSGITFTTGATQYWVGDTGSWSTAAEWGTTSGGSGGRVPLPQDDVVFDANSFSTTGLTVTQDMPRAGKSITWTGVTNTPTWTTSTTASVFGSITLDSGMTLTNSNQTYTFEGRGAYTLTSAGKTWAKGMILDAPGGSLTLQDALVSGSNQFLNISAGTFDANNKSVTFGAYSSTGSRTRSTIFGTGTWTLADDTPWNTSSQTNGTWDLTGSTIDITNSTLTFSPGGATLDFPSLTFSGTNPTITVTSGNYITATNLTINGTGTITFSGGSFWDVDNFTANQSTVSWGGTGGAVTITSHGNSFYNLTMNNNGSGGYSLADALIVSNDFTFTDGSFNAAGFAVTAGHFLSSNTNSRTITMGNGLWTLTGTGTVWDTSDTTNLTFTKGTSDIVISDTSATAKTFAGGGLTYNALTITGGGTGAVIFTGANTWSTFTINPPKTVTFPAGVTTTVTSFVATGTSGNLITINSSSSGSAATLSDTTGTNTVTYCSIKDSTATGGATWNARNSLNVSGNTGWIFMGASRAGGTIVRGFARLRGLIRFR